MMSVVHLWSAEGPSRTYSCCQRGREEKKKKKLGSAPLTEGKRSPRVSLRELNWRAAPWRVAPEPRTLFSSASSTPRWRARCPRVEVFKFYSWFFSFFFCWPDSSGNVPDRTTDRGCALVAERSKLARFLLSRWTCVKDGTQPPGDAVAGSLLPVEADKWDQSSQEENMVSVSMIFVVLAHYLVLVSDYCARN